MTPGLAHMNVLRSDAQNFAFSRRPRVISSSLRGGSGPWSFGRIGNAGGVAAVHEAFPLGPLDTPATTEPGHFEPELKSPPVKRRGIDFDPVGQRTERQVIFVVAKWREHRFPLKSVDLWRHNHFRLKNRFSEVTSAKTSNPMIRGESRHRWVNLLTGRK